MDCHYVATEGWACEGLDAAGVLKKIQQQEPKTVKDFKFGQRVRKGLTNQPNKKRETRKQKRPQSNKSGNKDPKRIKRHYCRLSLVHCGVT